MADDNEERKDGGSEREPLLRTSPSAAVLERRASYPGATTQHPTFGGSGDDDGSGASSDMARRGSYILRHSLQKAKEETKAKNRWADNVDELCALKVLRAHKGAGDRSHPLLTPVSADRTRTKSFPCRSKSSSRTTCARSTSGCRATIPSTATPSRCSCAARRTSWRLKGKRTRTTSSRGWSCKRS